MNCPLCRDIGWLLDANGAGMTEPKSLELIPCIHPECQASGAKIAVITFPEDMFHHAAYRGFVMSVST